MAYNIVSIGALLCEVMRKELEKPLDTAADFTGPYPSGDSGIMLDAAAKLGGNCAMVGVVGNDGFGKCIVDRMSEDGVDCSMIRVLDDASTGVAFVCYFNDGSRNFLYHVHDAACGHMDENDYHLDKIRGAKWLHISGFALSVCPGATRIINKLMEELPEDTKVCFDPNLRIESMGVEKVRALCKPVIDRASIIFPSKNEARLFNGTQTDDEGCRVWANQGKIVVYKNGENGCKVYDGNRVLDVPSFKVKEVDPTGAGDIFCAAFLVGMNEDKPLEECARFANAAGAISVQKVGPMEGTPSRKELEDFLKNN